METGLIPYLPSLRLFREWMRLRLEGQDDAGAWREIIGRIPRRDRRYLARTMVAGAHGQPPLMLSVPIEGGSSMLKRGDLGAWRVSMHGRWQDMHLGALSAAYSATPFYQHIEPMLRDVIKGAKEGMPFIEFTSALHRIFMDFLSADSLIPDLLLQSEASPELLNALAIEKSRGADTELSIIDVICRKGPESIFVLLPTPEYSNGSTDRKIVG